MPTQKIERFLGIDPGASGGFVMIQLDGQVVFTETMPATEQEIFDVMHNMAPSSRGIGELIFQVSIERVGGFVGGNPTPGSSMFNFGHNYGALRMASICLFGQVPKNVEPRVWQNRMGIEKRGKKESKESHKKKILTAAIRRFPDHPSFQGMRSLSKKGEQLSFCDALLIAEYSRLKYLGEIK